MTVTDWQELPLTLRMAHIASIYSLSLRTVRMHVERGDPSIPRPSFLRPYRWKKSEVRQHYEHHSVVEQRRAIAKTKREQLKVVS